MQTLRVLIGVLEVGAAVKFVSNADLVLGWGVFTRATVLGLWAILALFGALYLARLALVQETVDTGSRARGFAAAAAVSLFAVWLASGIGGRQLRQVEAFLPPSAPVALASTAGTTPTWILNDYTGALDAARASGKLVFIDFTGYTCTNCRWMEANIFTRPEIKASLDKYVLARLFTDGDGDIYDRQQALQQRQFGTIALPLYAVVDPDGNTITTFAGLTRNPTAFLSFLQRAL